MESVASPKWMVSKRYLTVWWASFWEKSLPSVGMCSLYPGWEWWAGALFPALRSKHATVWNRFCKHTTIALPTQVGLELAPHHVSTGCMPKPLLLHCSTWSWAEGTQQVYTRCSARKSSRWQGLSAPQQKERSLGTRFTELALCAS